MTEQHQNEPELRELIRRLLRGVCVVAALLSALFGAVELLRAGQLVNDEIRPGRIAAIEGYAKTGVRLQLDNGREIVFPDYVLYRRPQPLQLVVGDHVVKQRDTFVYQVNGARVTDVKWVLRNLLLPLEVVVPLVIYLVISVIYVVSYGRTPFGELMWGGDDKAQRRPRTRAGMIGAVLAGLAGLMLLGTLFLGCVSVGLRGVIEGLAGG